MEEGERREGAPSASKRRTQSTTPNETNPLNQIDPLGVGYWLTDKDILCYLNQELYHIEIHDPRAWTLAVSHINRVS